MVAGSALGIYSRGRTHFSKLPVLYLGIQGKQLRRFHHPSSGGSKSHLNRSYAIVRHPMYAGALVMLAGIPLALGSWWGLFFFFLTLPILIWRLSDEERFLHKNLPVTRNTRRKYDID